jgi:hypothetical protein
VFDALQVQVFDIDAVRRCDKVALWRCVSILVVCVMDVELDTTAERDQSRSVSESEALAAPESVCVVVGEPIGTVPLCGGRENDQEKEIENVLLRV